VCRGDLLFEIEVDAELSLPGRRPETTFEI
jgi:hypothetical protein